MTVETNSPECLPGLGKLRVLPDEIIDIVLDLACMLPASAAGPVLSSSYSAPDAQAAAALARVSHYMQFLVTPRIWKHVRLTRQSAVMSFHHALSSNTKLGRLVKAIFIGPDAPLPFDWHPVKLQFDEVSSTEVSPTGGVGITIPMFYAIQPSIIPHELPATDSESQPRTWSLATPKTAASCQTKAVFQALAAAQKAVNVSLTAPGRNHRKDEISKLQWLERTFEVQAALDLFIIKALRSGKEPLRSAGTCGCPRGTCPAYKSLYITDQKDSQFTPDHTITISTDDIAQQTARRFAQTDRLDHPLLFARSGLDVDGEQVDEDGLDRLGTPEVQQLQHPSTLLRPTIEHLLHAARECLFLTPNLTTLGLTGVFEKVVTARDGPSLGGIRCLSIGPPPRGLATPPRDLTAFSSLAELHICGIDLSEKDQIVVLQGLPFLQHIRWTMGQECAGLSAGVEDGIDSLMRASSSSRSLTVEVRLHPVDVVMLSTASLTAQAEQGGEGGDDDDGPRLLVRENDAAVDGLDYGSARDEVILREAAAWWERKL